MTRDEFERTTQMLVLMGEAATNLDLDEYLRAFDHADAWMPMVNPTLYKAAGRVGGHEATRELRNVAEAAARLAGAYRAMQEGSAKRLERHGVEAIREVHDDLGVAIDRAEKKAQCRPAATIESTDASAPSATTSSPCTSSETGSERA